ncbi:MAG TPA: DUF1993 domain-containing protein [Steroidobacteraceae bacterium]|nr:DUF1993 domain-containing protein [Steroidobacteraceae bacterium]
MKISVPAMSADLAAASLKNLAAILEKAKQHAAAKGFDPTVLVGSRLAPDMFPLARQVQIACDTAKGGVARLAGKEPPKFEDNEKTLDDLQARIGKTLDYIKSVAPAAFEGAEERDIQLPAGDRTLRFKGLDYLQRFVIPNVYFHIATAYNILRHNGVQIGKGDFLGAM